MVDMVAHVLLAVAVILNTLSIRRLSRWGRGTPQPDAFTRKRLDGLHRRIVELELAPRENLRKGR